MGPIELTRPKAIEDIGPTRRSGTEARSLAISSEDASGDEKRNQQEYEPEQGAGRVHPEPKK
jgi:hypothetical protein